MLCLEIATILDDIMSLQWWIIKIFIIMINGSQNEMKINISHIILIVAENDFCFVVIHEVAVNDHFLIFDGDCIQINLHKYDHLQTLGQIG